jgi:hypothetical protein
MIEKLIRWFEDTAQRAITYAVGVASQFNYFKPMGRDTAQLELYRTIYKTGGIPAQAVDVYALFMLSPGIRFSGSDETANETVRVKFQQMQMNKNLWLAVTRSLNYGDSFQEIIPYKNIPGISRVVHRWPGRFSIKTDDYGDLQGYEQELDNGDKIPVPVERIIHLALIPDDDIYGISLTGRALTEIKNDLKTTEGLSTGIERHGTGKHHWKLGNDDNPASAEDIRTWKNTVRTLRADSDIVSTHLFDVKEIDTSGIANVQQYSDVFLQRLCAAYGVPGELLGLRIGTTDATAVSRIDAFFQQIKTFQATLAETYQPVVDAIVGTPGVVTLSFNDASPRDDKARAEWITMLMNANKLDPFWIGESWVRGQFDIPEPAADDHQQQEEEAHAASFFMKNDRTFGGPGSGNWGHAGIPGQRGGSASEGGGSTSEFNVDINAPNASHDFKLSPSEDAALTSYISRDYQKINGALYGKTEMTPELEQTIQSLDSVIEKSTIAGGTTYSGIGRSGIEALKDISPGDSIKYSGYISSSTDRQYSIDAFASNAILEIKSGAGSRGYFVGGKESELIMPRGSILKCNGIKEEKQPNGAIMKTYLMERL